MNSNLKSLEERMLRPARCAACRARVARAAGPLRADAALPRRAGPLRARAALLRRAGPLRATLPRAAPLASLHVEPLRAVPPAMAPRRWGRGGREEGGGRGPGTQPVEGMQGSEWETVAGKSICDK